MEGSQYIDWEDENNSINQAHWLVYRHEDGPRALQLAIGAEKRLDAWMNKDCHDYPGEFWTLRRTLHGYLILAFVFVWNNRVEDAQRVDKHYLHKKPAWDWLHESIRPYLEILIAKNQKEYLATIFIDEAFRDRFSEHYDTYMKLLVDPDYKVANIDSHVAIRVRIFRSRPHYL